MRDPETAMPFAATAQAPPAAVATAPPTAAQAAQIEARYRPPGWGGVTAGPVDRYSRTYWRDAVDQDVIVGQYVADAGAGRVRLLASAKEAGFIFDGGCSVVNIRYRLSSGELDARCGGR